MQRPNRHVTATAAGMQTTKAKKATVSAPNESDVRARIVTAAYHCFERFGVAKTSMEDIASAAGLSRQTVYNHFSGRSAIIESVCLLEAVKVNAEVRKRVIRSGSFEERLADALYLIIRTVSENVYLKSFLEDVLFQAHASESESAIHQLNRTLWEKFLTDAILRGEMASDLGLDEVLSWLTLTQAAIQIKLSTGGTSDGELRRLISRFVVRPLCERCSATKTNRPTR